MSAPHHVREGLVDGNSLHEGGEIIEHLNGSIAQPLVVLEMATDEDQLRTEFARPPPGHPAADAESPGFVRSGKHNPTTNGDRLAAQGRVEQLLNGGVKRIEVRMQDGGCPFHLVVRLRKSRNDAPRFWNKKRTKGNACQAARRAKRESCRPTWPGKAQCRQVPLFRTLQKVDAANSTLRWRLE